jgi:hypothetical protein
MSEIAAEKIISILEGFQQQPSVNMRLPIASFSRLLLDVEPVSGKGEFTGTRLRRRNSSTVPNFTARARK